MASSSQFTLPSLLYHFKHNQVLHERVLLLMMQVTGFPTVPKQERVKFEELGEGFHRVVAYYGCMETPNVPRIMEKAFAVGIIIPSPTIWDVKPSSSAADPKFFAGARGCSRLYRGTPAVLSTILGFPRSGWSSLGSKSKFNLSYKG